MKASLYIFRFKSKLPHILKQGDILRY